MDMYIFNCKLFWVTLSHCHAMMCQELLKSLCNMVIQWPCDMTIQQASTITVFYMMCLQAYHMHMFLEEPFGKCAVDHICFSM